MRYVRTAMEEDSIVGRSYEAIIGAALYLAAREHGAIRPIPQIVEFSRVESSQIEQCIFALQKELGLKIKPPQPSEYLPWVLNSVRDYVSAEKRGSINWAWLHSSGREVLNQIESENRGQGCSPVVLAGTVTYYLNRSVQETAQLTQKEVAEPIDITGASIRSNRNLLEPLNFDHNLAPGEQPA